VQKTDKLKTKCRLHTGLRRTCHSIANIEFCGENWSYVMQ